jgi:hypothetical protein
MKVTAEQLKRVTKDFMEMAGEGVEVEEIDGWFYAYGSELACLRLEHKYNSKKARAEFSKNLNTWFFVLETNL